MYVDFDNQTVEFCHETLTKGQLWSLIELLEDTDDEGVLEVLNPDPNAGRENHLVRYVRQMQSDRTWKFYSTVQFEDGSFACSCDDWFYRRQFEDGVCKHVARAYSVLDVMMSSSRNVAPPF